MKRLLFFAAALCALATPAFAQAPVGEIGLYTDVSHSNWCATGTGVYQAEVYVWAKPTAPNGLKAVEFAIQYPSNVAPGAWVVNNDFVSLPFGNPTSGVMVAYYDCQNDWHWMLHQTVYVLNQDPGWAVLVKDPTEPDYPGPIACSCAIGNPIYPLEKTTNLCFNFCTSDFDSPFIMSVTKIDAQNLDVLFSEKVTPASAGAAASYTLWDRSLESTTVPILSADYQADSMTVRLSIGDPILAGRPYQLEAHDIVNLRGIVASSKKGFGDLPDLDVYPITVPDFHDGCAPLSVTLTIKNRGVGAAGPFDLQLFYSTDPLSHPRDLALGTFHCAPLAPGETRSDTYTFAWPDSSRIWYGVLPLLDPLDLIPESDESNNDGFGDWGKNFVANHLRVTDVPDDQGKLVRFEFETVTYYPEDMGWYPFMEYAVYRRDPGGWNLVATIPDNGSHKYYLDLPTLADSTESQGVRWSVFKVLSKIKLYESPVTMRYFESCPDSGYSVDNLAPTVVTGLTGQMYESGCMLSWQPNPEPDVAAYVVYRSTNHDFTPGPDTRIATVTGTFEYYDEAWYSGSGYCYKVRAKDAAGNEGPWGMTIPDQTIATLLKTFSATPKEAAVKLEWSLSTFDEGGVFVVSRADGEKAEFKEIQAADVSREGLSFAYLDEGVVGGETYRYRVSYLGSSGSQLLFETEAVSVANLPLTLHQNFPNPFNPATTISYYLPAAGHVRLDVFDASGKLVATLVDAQNTKGAHSVDWRGTNAAGAQVRSGIYFYRLRTHESTLTHKMVLLR